MSGCTFVEEDEIIKKIKIEFENKFKHILFNTLKLNKYLEFINKEITLSDNVKLIKQFTNSEIKEVVFYIRSEKSPRTDGMPIFFYQKYWQIIGPTSLK